MVLLEISVKEDLQGLEESLARVGDLRPVLSEIGELARTSIVRNFEVGGRPTRWKLSKRVEKKGGQTLIDKGLLKGSIAPSGPQVTADSVVIGTKDKRAGIHHFGGQIKMPGRVQTLAFAATGKFLSRKLAGRRKKGATRVAFAEIGARVIDMPARPFMVLQNEDMEQIRMAILVYISRGRGARW